MTEVVIVRHAQSVWNAVGRWQGWADPPLSELGERQAVSAGHVLRATSERPQRFASSDLQRAHRTAELLRHAFLDDAAPRPEDAILVDPDLREYDAGEWTGLRRDEIAGRWPGQLEAWASGRVGGPPGGEDSGHFIDRLRRGLERLHEVVPSGLVVVVSHGRAIHALATALGGPAGRIENLSGWYLRLAPGPELLTRVSLLEGPSHETRSPGTGDTVQDL